MKLTFDPEGTIAHFHPNQLDNEAAANNQCVFLCVCFYVVSLCKNTPKILRICSIFTAVVLGDGDVQSSVNSFNFISF